MFYLLLPSLEARTRADRPPEGAADPDRVPLPAAAPLGDGPRLRRRTGTVPGDRGRRRPAGAAAAAIFSCRDGEQVRRASTRVKASAAPSAGVRSQRPEGQAASMRVLITGGAGFIGVAPRRSAARRRARGVRHRRPVDRARSRTSRTSRGARLPLHHRHRLQRTRSSPSSSIAPMSSFTSPPP